MFVVSCWEESKSLSKILAEQKNKTLEQKGRDWRSPTWNWPLNHLKTIVIPYKVTNTSSDLNFCEKEKWKPIENRKTCSRVSFLRCWKSTINTVISDALENLERETKMKPWTTFVLVLSKMFVCYGAQQGNKNKSFLFCLSKLRNKTNHHVSCWTNDSLLSICFV